MPGAAREVNWILGHKGPYWAILRDDGGFRQRNHAAGTGQREGVVVKRQLYVYIWIWICEDSVSGISRWNKVNLQAMSVSSPD